MSGTEKRHRNFVGYEYKDIPVDSAMISLLLDGYENFGWEQDENLPENSKVIRLKRDRRILNKAELTRLQRNFEACIDEIRTLEKRKTSAASVWALIVGILGTAFMAGSTFAVTAQPPYIVLSILLAVPGFVGWILPCFLYRKIRAGDTKKITVLIEEKYDEIYELCEKGNKLLY